jgi:alkanesulfonate monooxygenase SsuD/methylene tetrahydromethanopterin reductase-like flavin-dependent oxidoreductase (luciferase family)
VAGAINEPKPVSAGGIPIIVGGNGQRVTWGLAARYADELNLDAVAPGRLPDALGTIRSRCEEAGRDPATLRVSVHLWLNDPAWLHDTREDDLTHLELLERYAATGIHRVMGLVPGCTTDSEALSRFAEAARAAGAELASDDAGEGPAVPPPVGRKTVRDTIWGPGETFPDRDETVPLVDG